MIKAHDSHDQFDFKNKNTFKTESYQFYRSNRFAKDTLSDGELMPICELSYYVHHAESLSEKEAVKREDRLTRAYVNGWTVEKPKLWNVKVPQKWSGDDNHYWTKEQDGALTWAYLINKDYMIPAQQFTAAEIEHYGLGECERVEVTDDGL